MVVRRLLHPFEWLGHQKAGGDVALILVLGQLPCRVIRDDLVRLTSWLSSQ